MTQYGAPCGIAHASALRPIKPCLTPKIFAILPLSSRPIPDLLQPDDAKAVEDVLIDASWFMINSSRPSMKGICSNFGR